MFPTPEIKLTQVISLKLSQLTYQISKRLDRVTFLFLITLLIVAGLRERMGEGVRNTQDTDKY